MLFLSKILSYIQPPVGGPKILFIIVLIRIRNYKISQLKIFFNIYLFIYFILFLFILFLFILFYFIDVPNCVVSYLRQRTAKPTIILVRPAKTQISLC